MDASAHDPATATSAEEATARPESARALVADADQALEALLHEGDARPDHAVAEHFAGTRVADIYAHLTGWHELFLGWLEADGRKATPDFPAKGYEWSQLAELNAALIDHRSHESYDDLRAALLDSHARVKAAVRAVPDDVLMDTTAHAWLGDESLGAVAHEVLGNHYRWGVAMLGECAGS